MAIWNSFCWSISGEVSHIASLLPSCDCALDGFASSNYHSMARTLAILVIVIF